MLSGLYLLYLWKIVHNLIIFNRFIELLEGQHQAQPSNDPKFHNVEMETIHKHVNKYTRLSIVVKNKQEVYVLRPRVEYTIFLKFPVFI